MANTNYATSGLAGANFAERSTVKEHDLGQVTYGNGNTAWIYVNAPGIVATGTCTVDASFDLTDTAGGYTADVAFTAGQYGWVRDTTGATA